MNFFQKLWQRLKGKNATRVWLDKKGCEEVMKHMLLIEEMCENVEKVILNSHRRNANEHMKKAIEDLKKNETLRT